MEPHTGAGAAVLGLIGGLTRELMPLAALPKVLLAHDILKVCLEGCF